MGETTGKKDKWLLIAKIIVGMLIVVYIFFSLLDVSIDGNKCYFTFGNTKIGLLTKEYSKVDKSGNVVKQVNVWR